MQTRWQADGKLTDRAIRARHCAGYTSPFVVVALAVGRGPLAWFAFPVAVFVGHYLTDSVRFSSTVGDWCCWRFLPPSRRADELQETQLRNLQVGDYHSGPMIARLRPSPEQAARASVPPNPWPPLPILVDQSLHLCQIAVLAGLMLR